MCSALKRPDFNPLAQYIIMMLLTFSGGFSPFVMMYHIRLLQIRVKSFHLNESFFLLIKSIGEIQRAQLKGPSTPEGSLVAKYLNLIRGGHDKFPAFHYCVYCELYVTQVPCCCVIFILECVVQWDRA